MRLTRAGASIQVSRLPLRILAILLASSGRMVRRAELKQALWPGSYRIDTERRLNTAIRALREALNDTANKPCFIETIRGCGYRWIGPAALTAEPALTPEPALKRWSAPFAPMGAHVAPLGLAALACLMLTTSASTHLGEAQTPQQRARFVQIAAMTDTDPGGAVAELDGLLKERPHYRAAQILRADLAVRRWREAPNDHARLAARSTLDGARAALGDDPKLDVLEAEIALSGDRDWAGAERLYRRAIALDAGDMEARKGLAWLLLNAGRREEALAQIESLMATSEITDGLRAELGWFLLRMRREDLALAMCGAGGSTNFNLLSCRHSALARLGRFEEARTVAIGLMRRAGADADNVASVRDGNSEAGYRRFLQWRTHGLLADSDGWFQRAQLQAEAGDSEQALVCLQRAYAAGEQSMAKLWSTPEFIPLRASPGFVALWRAVGPHAANQAGTHRS